jgi:hypothetical protein
VAEIAGNLVARRGEFAVEPRLARNARQNERHCVALYFKRAQFKSA